MASRKEYEMLFQLNAQLGSSYSKTFRAAQEEITAMQKEIQSLQDPIWMTVTNEAKSRRSSSHAQQA